MTFFLDLLEADRVVIYTPMHGCLQERGGFEYVFS